MMARKKIKFALMANENTRAISLKKRKSGLVKKVRELTILCDVKACLIMFSPNEVEPMVWPSIEVARVLLTNFTALPDFMKKKKETTLESYLKEKTWRGQENLKKTQKENMEYTIDQLMVQLNGVRKLADLHLSEIYSLLSFSKDAIMHLRKNLDSIQHSPLQDPPVYPFEAQVEEFRTTTDDVYMIGGSQENERAKKTYEEVKRTSIGTSKKNQSYYLMDEWFFPSFQPPYPQVHHQNVMKTASYNIPKCSPSYYPYQGSSSNGDHNLEMEPICPPTLALHDLAGSVSQPFQHHHNMINIPTMAMNQSKAKQYPFDFMRCEEQSNINNCSNAMTTNDGLDKEPPLPANGATTQEEGSVDAKSFDINIDWLGINNHDF